MKHGEEIKYIQEVFDTNWITTEGTNLVAIENQMSEKIGCKYAVALSCGTAALHLAVKLAGVKEGDTVFCTDMTFDATVNAVMYERAVPVFIDTEYDTWDMDPVALEKAFELYPNTKVIVESISTELPQSTTRSVRSQRSRIRLFRLLEVVLSEQMEGIHNVRENF